MNLISSLGTYSFDFFFSFVVLYFFQVFDAYAQFEELSLSKKMEEVAEMENPGDEEEVEVELKMARQSQLLSFNTERERADNNLFITTVPKVF